MNGTNAADVTNGTDCQCVVIRSTPTTLPHSQNVWELLLDPLKSARRQCAQFSTCAACWSRLPTSTQPWSCSSSARCC